MKNLWTLYRYEIKKLVRRPLPWVLIILLTAASLYVSFNDSMGMKVFALPDGENFCFEEVPYREWAIRSHNSGVSLNGKRIDDTFFKEMGAALPDMNDEEIKFWCFENNSAYGSFFEYMGGFNTMPRNLSLSDYYSIRRELMDGQWDFEGLTDGEKAYWSEKADHLLQPLVYQEPWPGAFSLFEGMLQLLILFPVAAAVFLCPSFSDDKSKRMDSLILASKKSRLPLYLTKSFAGLTVAILAGAIIIGGYLAGAFSVWGMDGLNAPFQMIELAFTGSSSIGGLILYLSFLLILFTVVCGAITMLVSLLTRNTAAALIMPIVCLFFVLRMRPKVTRLTILLPQYMIGMRGIRNDWLNGAFGIYLDGFQMFLLLCVGLILFLSILGWLGWRQKATNGK